MTRTKEPRRSKTPPRRLGRSWHGSRRPFVSPGAALSIKRARLLWQHDWNAVADRIGKLGRARNQFLILRVIFEGRLGARTHQDFKQPRIDPRRLRSLFPAQFLILTRH